MDDVVNTKLVIGYTRGRKLHAMRLAEGNTKYGRTLCGRAGFRHPHFGDDAVVDLSLRINGGCAHCIRKLEEE